MVQGNVTRTVHITTGGHHPSSPDTTNHTHVSLYKPYKMTYISTTLIEIIRETVGDNVIPVCRKGYKDREPRKSDKDRQWRS